VRLAVGADGGQGAGAALDDEIADFISVITMLAR